MSVKDELRVALSKLPPRPWETSIVPPSSYQRQGFTITPGDDPEYGPQGGFDVGKIRSINGANVIEPWPESASMVIAIPGVLQALVTTINLAQAYVDEPDPVDAVVDQETTTFDSDVPATRVRGIAAQG